MKGEKVKEMRLKRRYGQSELADLIGIHRSTLYKIETGSFTPSVDLLNRLAKELNCSIKSFF